MNKGDMIDQLAETTELPKSKVKQIVEQIFDTDNGLIATALKKGDRVTLPGFGTFEARKRPARTGRNPQTGKEIKIAASTAAAYKPGKGMKDSLKGS